MARASSLGSATTMQPPLIMTFGTNAPLLHGARVSRQDAEQAGDTCTRLASEGRGRGFFHDGRCPDGTIRQMDRFLAGTG